MDTDLEISFLGTSIMRLLLLERNTPGKVYGGDNLKNHMKK